jgi:hypothetical protein
MNSDASTLDQLKQLLQSLGGGVVLINNLTINVNDLQVGDRAILNEAPRPAKRRAGRDELYCVECGKIILKASFEWVCRDNRTVYCLLCAGMLR